MSVDTYLERKNVEPYQRVSHEDIELLLAPRLLQQVGRISLQAKRGLFGRKLLVDAFPRNDHFHGPGCRH